jgi:glutathione peroxidase
MKRSGSIAATVTCATAALVSLVLAGSEDQGTPANQTKGTTMQENHLSIPFKTIDGHDSTLSAFKGKAVLIVNVASKCGHTPQYKGLDELFRKYKAQGLVVVGFPANNFGQQEPGTNAEIREFCTIKYAVTFPMMAKVSVKGEDIHPLFAWLTQKSPYPGDIKWNFGKFLLDKKGEVVARFAPEVDPLDSQIVSRVAAVLK